MTRTIGFILMTCAAAALLAVTACETRTNARLTAAEVPSPSRHAIHSEQLRQVMAHMGNGVRETWPQEIAADKAREEREMRFDEAADLAAELAESARSIPQAVTTMDMTPDDRHAFMNEVQKLATLAERLRADARAQNREAMHQSLDQIKATCIECHNQFRQYTGPANYGS